MKIYVITNVKNGKVLIGQTAQNGNTRWNRHKSLCRRNVHFNQHFQSAWNKYGEEAFICDVLQDVQTREELNRLETYYIVEVYDSMNPNKGYNKTTGGEHTRVSEETRRKHSEAAQAEKNSMYGKKHTKETLQKMCEVKKGKNHPMYGRTHSEETKQKMSESQLSRKGR